MKKAFLTAFTALCAFAAQAVTVTWSNVPENITFTNGSFVDIDSVMPFTLTAQPGLNDGATVLLNSITLFSRTDANRMPDHLAFNYVNASNRGDISAARNITKTINIGTGTDTINEMTFIFEQPVELTVGQTYDLTAVAANGNKFIYSSTGFGCYVDSTAQSTTGLMTASGNGVNFTPLYTIEATIPSVPEPTALALLALGVAGLALKRKIA